MDRREATALAAYHPILAATAAGVIDLLDQEICGGNWRTWKRLLLDAIGIGITADTGISEREANQLRTMVVPAPSVRRRKAR